VCHLWPVPKDAPFTHEDLDVVTACVADAWRAGADRDWSVPAGTLEWSCARTADHALDAVLAVAFFLASGRRDGYPEWGWTTPTPCQDGRPDLAGDAMAAVGRVLSAVIATAPPGASAVIWRRPLPEVRPASDFAARGALEMILHGHDVCADLGVPFSPPPDVCTRLREHSRGWPHWRTPGWHEAAATDDPWADLLAASGRRPY
jgi:hypothetical protein